MEKITEYLIQSTVNTKEVRAWNEDIVLPTYEIGQEEKNPIFLEKRVYQGSSGAVYPYPVVEKISDIKVDKTYHAIFIENYYLKIMILPELGGRVHMAYDKIKKRHFVYYNQVVKPALVGLTGPWISGGIEFNWPQHHRPSTFLPTDSRIETNKDGSMTIWCNEVERMFRTKGAQGFTLYPDKAYLEINVRLYNRTPFPQTFLWWANPAVVVNEHYHSVFPPDVNAVFDHGKRDVSSFPIATGVYYKQDYSAGVDISKYKNIPVPTSYMAIRSKYDFVGGYETNEKGGLLHVANHNVSPGKKQWTWGNSDFGLAWDRNLTDEDGPYIELMTGVYTDNQPDFSWLLPYEEKSWKQYFMPYSEVGYVKNATKEAIVNLDVHKELATIILYTTSVYTVRVVLRDQSGILLFEKQIQVSPESPYKEVVPVLHYAVEDLKLQVFDQRGKVLVEYKAEKPEVKPLPEPAKAAKSPKEVTSTEQLYLTGLHLEQYRHATYNPMDYYLEALYRDETDIRCNNAVGLLLMRKGQFEKAEAYFKRAIETLTQRNPNPYDGEPLYQLGLCYKIQDKNVEAYESLFKATWNMAWQDAAYFSLAQIDTAKENYIPALDNVERSLVRNWHNHKSRQLKSSVLRKLGRKDEALSWIEASLKVDYFNIGCHFEKYLLTNDIECLETMKTLMRGWVHNYLEYALDFAAAGLYDEAIRLLLLYTETSTSEYPTVWYALGYFNQMTGNLKTAREYYNQAEKCSPDYCFPNRFEEVIILQDAVKNNPGGAKAHYFLGNFWYSKQQYENAISSWEKSKELDDTFPTVWRNLSLAYFNTVNEKGKAVAALERAFALDSSDARILMELDQLYKKQGRPHKERLAFLAQYPHLVYSRDDLNIEYILLYNQLEQFDKAKELIDKRIFHPWEGGEGKITGQYTFCRVELAKQAIKQKKFTEAITLLHETDSYPHNLGEGKLPTTEENDVDYYKGVAYEGLGEFENARISFERATIGSSEPQIAFFYNDSQPDKIFYQGLAWKALKNEKKARSCFNKLIKHGEKHLFDECRIDYFAVSLPDLAIWNDDLNTRNLIHCKYVMGLGYLGLGDEKAAARFFTEVRNMDINHQGAQIHLNMCKS
jgi:tetratricopeptide (TPR) repeat protein